MIILFNALLLASAVNYTLIFMAAEYVSRYYFALMLAMHSAIYDVKAEKKLFTLRPCRQKVKLPRDVI